jgi:multiple sugar transport system ATP-binding protein
MAEIKISNVTKRFGNFVAVDNVSVTVEDQEFVVLLGPSGCGKTTLLRTVAGLGMADEGAISIGGRDVTYLPPRDRKISMVFQSYAIFPHMKVYDNVAFGLRMNKFDKKVIESACIWQPRLLHIENMLDRFPSKMSGGQRQRVAVARAIAMQSQVLLDGRTAQQPGCPAAPGNAGRAQTPAALRSTPPPFMSPTTRSRRSAWATASR